MDKSIIKEKVTLTNLDLNIHDFLCAAKSHLTTTVDEVL